MRKLFFVVSVVGSVFFMAACGSNDGLNEENTVPVTDAMEVAVAATDSPPSPAPAQAVTVENVPDPTPYCHGRYDEIGSFCVYIENFSTDNDYIVVRPVEWIIPEDEKRIKELGLDMEKDLIPGYYIKDWGFSEMKIPITENTEYHFIDYGHDFSELQKLGLCTITKEEEIFISYWEKYTSMMHEYPFFVELNEDGTLKLISEKVIP